MLSLNEPARGGITASIGVIPLRLGAALILLCRHAWSQIPQAYQALWNARAWDVIDQIESAGLPFAKFLSLLSAFIVGVVSLGWLLGFLTRFCAFLLMPLALAAIAVCNHAGNGSGAEAALLYFFIAVTVAYFGPGGLSLDALFRRRSRDSRRLRYHF